MTAVCRVCGKEWNVSENTDPDNYVCPECSLRDEYIAAGIIKPMAGVQDG